MVLMNAISLIFYKNSFCIGTFKNLILITFFWQISKQKNVCKSMGD